MVVPVRRQSPSDYFATLPYFGLGGFPPPGLFFYAQQLTPTGRLMLQQMASVADLELGLFPIERGKYLLPRRKGGIQLGSTRKGQS